MFTSEEILDYATALEFTAWQTAPQGGVLIANVTYIESDSVAYCDVCWSHETTSTYKIMTNNNGDYFLSVCSVCAGCIERVLNRRQSLATPKIVLWIELGAGLYRTQEEHKYEAGLTPCLHCRKSTHLFRWYNVFSENASAGPILHGVCKECSDVVTESEEAAMVNFRATVLRKILLLAAGEVLLKDILCEVARAYIASFNLHWYLARKQLESF